jgi:hypothetical protein
MMGKHVVALAPHTPPPKSAAYKEMVYRATHNNPPVMCKRTIAGEKENHVPQGSHLKMTKAKLSVENRKAKFAALKNPPSTVARKTIVLQERDQNGLNKGKSGKLPKVVDDWEREGCERPLEIVDRRKPRHTQVIHQSRSESFVTKLQNRQNYQKCDPKLQLIAKVSVISHQDQRIGACENGSRPLVSWRF